jgi:hypothetical protein
MISPSIESVTFDTTAMAVRPDKNTASGRVWVTPEEFAAKQQMSSAVARAAWPAADSRAGPRGATRPGLGSKTRQFFGHPQEHVKGGQKNLGL